MGQADRDSGASQTWWSWWRSWRWWGAAAAIPLSYHLTVAGDYGGEWPQLILDELGPFAIDLATRYVFWVVLLVGVPSLVAQLMRPNEPPELVGPAGYLLLAGGLIAPIVVAAPDEGGDSLPQLDDIEPVCLAVDDLLIDAGTLTSGARWDEITAAGTAEIIRAARDAEELVEVAVAMQEARHRTTQLRQRGAPVSQIEAAAEEFSSTMQVISGFCEAAGFEFTTTR